MPVTCEWDGCGREFDAERGMKLHHAKIHGVSIAGKKVECHWCETTIRRLSSKLDRTENTFCSHDCRKSWQLDGKCGDFVCDWCGKEDHKSPAKLVGDNNFCSKECQGKYQTHQAREYIDCGWCGSELHRPKSRIEEHDNQFCDMDCRWDYRTDKLNITTKCGYCDTKITKMKCKVTTQDNVYCDSGCRADHLTEIYRGSGNPQWVGGHLEYYGPSWVSERRKALDRTGGCCSICGMGTTEHIEEFDTVPHAHHIKPARSFGKVDDANEQSNLIPLCQICHNDVEGLNKDTLLHDNTFISEAAVECL